MDGSPSPERTAEDREFREAAERAVIELPDDLREAFTLRFWHEFGYDEIGADPGRGRRRGALAVLRRPTAIAGEACGLGSGTRPG